MDRRTKLILLIIGSVLLLGAVIWFFIWPLLKPVLPSFKKAQPPEVSQPNPQNVPVSQPSGDDATPPVFVYSPGDYPDMERIAELGRRAGVFAETIESGSNQKTFENMTLAGQGVTASLRAWLQTKRAEMQAKHPVDGPVYLTIAQRLVEIPEHEAVISGDTFTVKVQLQVSVKDGDASTVEYHEATVTFTDFDGDWLLSSYKIKPYTP